MIIDKTDEFVPLREAAPTLGYRTTQGLAYHLATTVGAPPAYAFGPREVFLKRADVEAYAAKMPTIRDERQQRRAVRAA